MEHTKQFAINSINIETFKESDRVIILFFEDHQLVGINFHQGIDLNYLPDFQLNKCSQLFDYLTKQFAMTHWWNELEYSDWCFLHNSCDYTDILDWIDHHISKYCELTFTIREVQIEISYLQAKLTNLENQLNKTLKTITL